MYQHVGHLFRSFWSTWLPGFTRLAVWLFYRTSGRRCQREQLWLWKFWNMPSLQKKEKTDKTVKWSEDIWNLRWYKHIIINIVKCCKLVRRTWTTHSFWWSTSCIGTVRHPASVWMPLTLHCGRCCATAQRREGWEASIIGVPKNLDLDEPI